MKLSGSFGAHVQTLDFVNLVFEAFWILPTSREEFQRKSQRQVYWLQSWNARVWVIG
jgi:hypothetical protein